MHLEHRLFAVIPAAGESRRMGRPKLLLPLGEKSVIARLLEVLDRDEIAARVVVVRPDDEPLRREVEAVGALVVQPSVPPPDMRTSVERALEEIDQKFSPAAGDGWMLIPADHPMLATAVLDDLILRWRVGDASIVVPTFAGRRGHPALFRWELAKRVAEIPPGKGLNALVAMYKEDVVEVPINDPAIITDLDTPEDYQTLLDHWNKNQGKPPV